MEELLKTYGSQIKTMLEDPKNQQVALIAGAAYLISKNDKERNAAIAAVASYVLLPDADKTKTITFSKVK
jgi:hypothetical protein